MRFAILMIACLFCLSATWQADSDDSCLFEKANLKSKKKKVKKGRKFSLLNINYGAEILDGKLGHFLHVINNNRKGYIFSTEYKGKRLQKNSSFLLELDSQSGERIGEIRRSELKYYCDFEKRHHHCKLNQVKLVKQRFQFTITRYIQDTRHNQLTRDIDKYTCLLGKAFSQQLMVSAKKFRANVVCRLNKRAWRD